MKYSENACALKDQRIALDWDWRPSPNRVAWIGVCPGAERTTGGGKMPAEPRSGAPSSVNFYIKKEKVL